MPGSRRVPFVGLAIVWTALGATAGRAQPPTPCPTPSPVPQCPPQSTSPGPFVNINIVPEGDSCRFESEDIPDLDTFVGGGVHWTFCSTCALATQVKMDTSGSGPFHRFAMFFPQPQADNLVNVDVPCFGLGTATGNQATSGDPDWWKYELTVTPGEPPLNHIDPRLEIDDNRLAQWLWGLLFILIGALLGALGMKLMRKRTP